MSVKTVCILVRSAHSFNGQFGSDSDSLPNKWANPNETTPSNLEFQSIQDGWMNTEYGYMGNYQGNEAGQ